VLAVLFYGHAATVEDGILNLFPVLPLQDALLGKSGPSPRSLKRLNRFWLKMRATTGVSEESL